MAGTHSGNRISAQHCDPDRVSLETETIGRFGNQHGILCVGSVEWCFQESNCNATNVGTMKWETRFVRRLLLVMYAIDLFRRCALFGRAWQLPCWDGVDVLGSCHCRCSHDLNRHPANAKLRMGWLDCREAKKCFAAKQPILSNVGRLIIKLSPPKFLKIFLFFRGGQHSNSKFLEAYGWDHYWLDNICSFFPTA